MKKEAKSSKSTSSRAAQAQPKPVTPGVSKGMVRQHAYELYRDKLKSGEKLSLEDWVLAEKDLVKLRDTGELVER